MPRESAIRGWPWRAVRRAKGRQRSLRRILQVLSQCRSVVRSRVGARLAGGHGATGNGLLPRSPRQHRARTAWLGQPCSQNDMNAASTPYHRPAGPVPEAHGRTPESLRHHGHHSAGSAPVQDRKKPSGIGSRAGRPRARRVRGAGRGRGRPVPAIPACSSRSTGSSRGCCTGSPYRPGPPARQLPAHRARSRADHPHDRPGRGMSRLGGCRRSSAAAHSPVAVDAKTVV